jgi:hypothetical protein
MREITLISGETSPFFASLQAKYRRIARPLMSAAALCRSVSNKSDADGSQKAVNPQ